MKIKCIVIGKTKNKDFVSVIKSYLNEKSISSTTNTAHFNEVSFDEKWLNEAIHLLNYVFEHFFDENIGSGDQKHAFSTYICHILGKFNFFTFKSCIWRTVSKTSYTRSECTRKNQYYTNRND